VRQLAALALLLCALPARADNSYPPVPTLGIQVGGVRKQVKAINFPYGSPISGGVLSPGSVPGGVAGSSEGLACTAPIPVPAWTGSTAVILGERRLNSGKTYQVITVGTTAGSGGPTTTSADITDGTAHWKYLGAGIVSTAATGNGTTDDTLGLQAWAAQLIIQKQQLGTIPTGSYKVTSPGVDFSAGNVSTLVFRSPVIRGTGESSSIYPAATNGTTYYAFTFRNNGYDDQTVLRDIAFRGTVGVNVDAGGALSSDGQLHVENVRFSNLSCGLQQCLSGVNYLNHVLFLGVGGGQKVSEFELVRITGGNAVIRDFQFWDIDEAGGGAIGKVGDYSGGNLPTAAIFVTSNGASDSVLIEDGLIDETIGYQGIRIAPASGSTPRVEIRRVVANVAATVVDSPIFFNEDPHAFIRAKNVDKLVVDGSRTQHNAVSNSYSIWATSVKAAEIRNFTMDPVGPVNWLFESTCTYVEIIESDYAQSALNSSATKTRVLKGGVWSVLTTNPSGAGANQLDAVYSAWQATHTYVAGDRVTNGGHVYQASIGGVSAGSGGPTGTDGINPVVDSGVTWIFAAAPTPQYVRVKENLFDANGYLVNLNTANVAAVSYSALSLVNGWVNNSSFNITGYYKDQFGFVHLTGLVQSGSNTLIGTLPAKYCPSKIQRFTALSAGGTLSDIDINSDGTINLASGLVANVSLEGLSFLATQ
jgi:hypothetical protein